MADFGLSDIAVSWAWEKEAGTAQVLQAEDPDDIPDWVHVTGKADDSANWEDQSAASLHHRDGSDGAQEWENMPVLIWKWRRKAWALSESYLVA